MSLYAALLSKWSTSLMPLIGVFVVLVLSCGAGRQAVAEEPFLSQETYDQVSLPGRDGSRENADAPTDVTSAAVELILGLLVVLALAIGAAYLLKRATANGRRILGPRGEHLEVLESTSLGLKRSVTLVRVGDQVVVVGQAEQGLTGLATMPLEHLGAVREPVDGDVGAVSVAVRQQTSAPLPPASDAHEPLDGGAEPKGFAESLARQAAADSYTPSAEAQRAAAQDQQSAGDRDQDAVADFQARLRRLQGGR